MMANLKRFVERQEMRHYPDVDEFNERAVQGKRGTPLRPLLDDLDATHGEMVRFLRDLPKDVFDSSAVEWRIRIDTYDHYREHAENIRRWLIETPSS